MLFVILFFAPDILIHEKASMREIVDRHFNDNFILTTYMGAVADLSLEWAAYPAARLALANTLEPSNIAHITKRKAQQTQRSIDELNYFLTEGVLTEMYVLENLDPLLNCIRNANVTIRWTMMHSRIQPMIPMMENSTAQREIFDKGTDPDKLITLLLKVSQLEWKLKQMFEALLASKEDRWQRCMKETSERMEELSEYFSGEKPLTRVERNEDLMKWFKDLAEKVNSLDYVDHIKAGRRIKRLIEALGHVEQFDQIDTNLQVKAYLEESREFLTEMVRTVRIRDEVMGIIENVSDLSYAWEIINDFMKILHQRVKNDPSSVILLRAMFLKFASILDVPLTRIHQCGSEDVISVAEYYSAELVDYVRRVMEVIPQSVFRILAGIIKLQTDHMKPIPSVFRILAGIIKLQTDHMKPIPVKFENTLLKNHAQLNERYRLARATNEVSKYTEGILAMKRTLLGIIEVDPRQVLEDGLRKELVYRVSLAFHEVLIFEKNTSEECNEIFVKLASNLDAYRLSFEYIQDYIGIYGLRMWHEELSRIINYNVEQECNRYLKKKVYDRASQYQSRAIPIPRFQPPSGDMSVNFMGRLMHALFIMTDPHTTIYSPQSIGWFSEDGSEVCGIGAFSVLHKSVGLLGLAGLDRMLSFRIVHTLNNLVKFWGSAVTPYFPLLDQLSAALVPEWKLPEHSTKLYEAALKKVEKIMSKLLKAVLIIGQAALIRRQISSELSFSSRLDANLLATTLDTLNISLLNDIRAHYRDPKNKPYPGSEGNPVLVELNKYLENTGANDPFQKIYVTVAEPMEGLAAMFMLFVVAYSARASLPVNKGSVSCMSTSTRCEEPLLVGILTIFKQFHPSYTEKFLAYLGQFVRTKVNDIFAEKADKKGKSSSLPTELPVDVVNSLIFMLEFARCAKIKRSILDGHVPAQKAKQKHATMSESGTGDGGLAPESLGALETRKSSGGLLVVHESAQQMILVFVKHLNESIKSKRISSEYEVSPNVQKAVDLVNEINSWIDEIPPIQQPMRFGNKAFRTFYDRVVERTPAMQENMLPEELRGAVIELAAYLDDSFGNRVRIDYGTGHETSFIVWMCCLHKLGFFKQSDFPALVLRLFTTYLALMRRLQKLYMLEPAGSHGVWGLDDYHCLPFYFGSAQLIGQHEILPESVHDDNVLEASHTEYLYLDAIKFIKEVKAGSPFAETSPMLNDISALPSWEKTNGGMLKLYEGEVLKKLPVIQHLRFGSLFPCTWTPSHEADDGSTYIPVSTHPGTSVRAPNFDLEGVSAKAPWVAVETLAATKDTAMSPLRNTKK
ncbi:Strumpellin, partial [Phytophthora palmivora]